MDSKDYNPSLATYFSKPFYTKVFGTLTLNMIAEQNTKLAVAKKSRQKEAIERDMQKMITKRKLKSLVKVTVTPIELILISF